MRTPATDLPATPAVAAPDAPVRMAIVGANFGAGIARRLAVEKDFVVLTHVCDLDVAKAQSVARELGVGAADDLDALLADPGCEAVGVFTGPVGRARIISKVLRAGKHVMTTKPFDLDLAATEAVFAQARERGLVVHLNSPAPVPSEDIAQIRNWIETHDLGRPIAMRAETWCSYREQASGGWYDDPVLCPAAPIFRLGVYFLNDFASLMGQPVRVQVMQSRVLTGRPTSDNAQVSIEFANGALAHVFASFCVQDGDLYRDQVTLNFQHGTIRRWVERGPAHMADDWAVAELRRQGVAPVRAQTRPGAFAGWYDWRAFQSAIRGRGNVPAQNADAVLFGVRLLEAMQRSSLSGEPEAVHAPF